MKRAARYLQHWTPVLVSLAIVAVIAISYAQVSTGAERAATVLVIYVCMVVGLYVFSGMSGVVSFGHASFLAVAGYMSAYLTIQPTMKKMFLPALPDFLVAADMSLLPAMLMSGGAAAVFAALIGYPLMRLKGIEASVATFSITVIVYAVASNWEGMTGGKSAVVLPTSTTMWVALGALVGVLVVAFAFQGSRWGLLLRATREDDVAAASIGARLHRLRFAGWVLSAFLTGIAGSVYVHYLGAITADVFWLSITFMPIAMLVIGGLKSLSGAVVGAVVAWGIAELLYTLEKGVSLGALEIKAPNNIRELGLGALMLLILVFRPSGIMGGKEFDLRPIGRWLVAHRRIVGKSKAARTRPGRTEECAAATTDEERDA